MKPVTTNPETKTLGLQNWLTERAVAQMTGMSVATVRRWRLSGDGPKFFKMNSVAIRYPKAAVEAWVSSQPTGGQQ